MWNSQATVSLRNFLSGISDIRSTGSKMGQRRKREEKGWASQVIVPLSCRLC